MERDQDEAEEFGIDPPERLHPSPPFPFRIFVADKTVNVDDQGSFVAKTEPSAEKKSVPCPTGVGGWGRRVRI